MRTESADLFSGDELPLSSRRCFRLLLLEPEPELGLHRSWRNKMGARNTRKKIVERHFVGEISHCDFSVEMVVLPMPDVVETGSDIKQVSRSNTRRIAVGIVAAGWDNFTLVAPKIGDAQERKGVLTVADSVPQ
jgi:hypothetical protein